jgi:uncharacterized protein (TIGR03083 family)
VAGQAIADHGRLLDVLAVEGELLAKVVHGASADAPVPTCPGLTIRETARHVGSVYRMVRSWLTEGTRPAKWQQEPLPGESAVDYLREGHRALLAELREHTPDERAPTWWSADPTYGFWRRRMAHETTIHRIDVQNAVGAELAAVPEDIAVDGVDEALALWFGQKLPMLGLSGTKPGSVGVRTGGHHWIATAGPSETTAWRCSAEEAGRADSIVSDSPMRVYVWLWGRSLITSVPITGNYDAAAQLWALLRLATR